MQVTALSEKGSAEPLSAPAPVTCQCASFAQKTHADT